MAYNLQSAGNTVILSLLAGSSATTAGTTSQAGSWYEVNPKIYALAFQVTQTPSSAGATLSSTVYIEVSNDGVYPVATKAQTFALTGTTWQSDGAVFATSMNGAWRFVRANANSISTSTSGSAGIGTLTVTACARTQY